MYKSLGGHYKERCSSHSHMLATQIPSIQSYGALNFQTWYWKLGRRLEILIGEFFKKSMKIYMMSHVKVRSSTTYYILLAIFGELFIELYNFKLTMGFQQWLARLPSFWLVSQATSRS
jgi:hypothetical protein